MFSQVRGEQLWAFTYTNDLNFIFSKEDLGTSDDSEGQTLCLDALKKQSCVIRNKSCQLRTCGEILFMM